MAEKKPIKRYSIRKIRTKEELDKLTEPIKPIERGSPADQPVRFRRPGAVDCVRCHHPAVYHGRALPHCDACDCPGYERKT